MRVDPRGGIPVQVTITVPGAGIAVPAMKDGQRLNTKYIALFNEGAVDVQVFWSKADLDAGKNYFTLHRGDDAGSATQAVKARWQGPVELADDHDSIYLKSVGADVAVTVLFLQARL